MTTQTAGDTVTAWRARCRGTDPRDAPVFATPHAARAWIAEMKRDYPKTRFAIERITLRRGSAPC